MGAMKVGASWARACVVIGALAPFALSGGITVQFEDLRLDDVEVGAGDAFGTAVALSGNTALIGAPNDQAVGATRTGVAYVFRGQGTSWTLEARLTAPDPNADDFFGSSVALYGETAVVGAQGDDITSGADAGSAYVFVRSGTTWSFQQKLEASDGALGDAFGASVAVNTNTCVVGALFDDDAGSSSGSAYVFDRVGTTWTESAKLAASDAAGSDLFGSSAAFDGSTIVLGAPGEAVATGAAYVFTRPGRTWMEDAKLVASDGVNGDRFGVTAVQGDTLVIGAEEALSFAGAAYVFTRSGTTWSQQMKLVAPDGIVGDRLASSVALDDELLALGAPGHDAVQASAGGAYLFRRVGTAWSFDRKLLGSDSTSVNLVGGAIGVAGGTIVVGGAGPFAGSLPGSVYAFSVPVTTTSFCDGGDGALAFCPCGNAGSPDTGCDIQQGLGGVRLDAIEQVSGPPNRVTLSGQGFPVAFAPTVILIRSPSLDSSGPSTFGDGLICVGVPVVRLGATFASAGASDHRIGHHAMAGTGTFYYQAWFRNTPAMFCTPSAFNLSSGRTLTW
jgi:hypothetical protein